MSSASNCVDGFRYTTIVYGFGRRSQDERVIHVPSAKLSLYGDGHVSRSERGVRSKAASELFRNICQTGKLSLDECNQRADEADGAAKEKIPVPMDIIQNIEILLVEQNTPKIKELIQTSGLFSTWT